MAISLTGGGIPCQEITATDTGTTVEENGGTYRVQSATLPIGIPTKLKVKFVGYSNSKVNFSGTCFVLISFVGEVVATDSSKFYALKDISYPVSNTYKPMAHFFGGDSWNYVIRLA